MSANFDKVYETWTGDRKGVKPFVDYYTEWFKHQTKIKGEIVEKIGVIFVTSDVAIAKARVKFTGWLDESGAPLPDRHLLQAEVMVKKNGKWLRAAAFLRPVEE